MQSASGRPPGPTQPWHTASVAAIEAELATGAAGLAAEEAAARLLVHGPNVVDIERDRSWWQILLHQFRDPLIYVLLAAAGVTLALREFTDAGVILSVVVLNAIIGFVQERRAENSIRALARLSAPRAEVVRDGAPRNIAARDLVPGDIVLLTSGTQVPADLRLTLVRDLEVDESMLTGESLTARKLAAALERETLVPGDQRNMAFAGTTVTRGRARGIVVRTGSLTELGRIATAVREVGQVATPLQENVAGLGRRVGVIVAALAAITVVVGVLRGLAAGEIFVAAVAMAVSAIPEGLPVVMTITLAIAVKRMARRRAIVRALPAVETLGCTTVIASDKTGTLTANEMTVRTVWAGRSYLVEGVGYTADGAVTTEQGSPIDPADEPALRRTLLTAVLANEADPAGLHEEPPRGDPTELALHVAAARSGLPPADARLHHAEIDIVPFEPERRFMATLNRSPDGVAVIHLKGAPEVVLERCSRQLDARGHEIALDRDAVLDTAASMAASGLRVLAMADRTAAGDRLSGDDPGDDFILNGLTGMEDPVRPEVLAAVEDARGAGIRVIMLTGDHAGTAHVVGQRLGLTDGAGGVAEGHRIESLADAELGELLREVNVFARVAPEHKLRIVQQLRAQGHVVAVTGDGVNDAPALRAAHLGIAMGASGTDVAREAADMVLADDNFSTITAAVEEGRVVFANIRKVVFFLLSTAVGEVMTILFALAAGWALPFTAAQILWVNLVTNGLQDVALGFEPGEPGLLRRPPRRGNEGIVSPRLLRRLGAVGAVLAAGTLGMFAWTLHTTGDLAMARTVATTQMVVFQFFHVFNCRSLDRSVLQVPAFSNPFLFVSLMLAAVAHLAVLHLSFLQSVFRMVPLSLAQWGAIAAVGTLVVVGGELDKWWNRRTTKPLG